jgi:predicted TPR repeat methyltransferase
MQSADAALFDAAYYERFYFDQKTRVSDPQHVERLGTFVCSYLHYLRVPVRRVLDVGCGIGLWRDIVARHFPQARFHGVELSEYLCQRYGWTQGSVVDYTAREPFDLVVCQGVLAYLSPGDLKRALRNLGTLTRGALYLEVVTREDYENDIVDDTLTDPRLFRHRAEAYRRGLAPSFRHAGGGVWLSRDCEVPLYAMECADDA